MRAMITTSVGGPEVLTLGTVPDPIPAPGEVVIDIAACGVNRADTLQTKGLYPPPPGASDIVGLEVSGHIAALGPAVTSWQVGQPCCALLSGGGYATQVAVPVGQLLPIPAGIDLISAAALPEVACTVWSNVVMTARLCAGELLLVHGGGSGIGTMAIQIGRACGATVAVTAGSDATLARCAELGAQQTINYREADFATILRDKANVILDIIGAKYLQRNVSALADRGRLVIIGLQGGRKAELDISALLSKRGSITATSLRTRPATGPGSKADVVTHVREHLWPLIATGQVRPVVHRRYPLAEAAQAHRDILAGGHIGKILLTV